MDRLPFDTIQRRERQGPAAHAPGPTRRAGASRRSRSRMSPVAVSRVARHGVNLATVWCFWPRHGPACRLSRSRVSAVIASVVGVYSVGVMPTVFCQSLFAPASDAAHWCFSVGAGTHIKINTYRRTSGYWEWQALGVSDCSHFGSSRSGSRPQRYRARPSTAICSTLGLACQWLPSRRPFPPWPARDKVAAPCGVEYGPPCGGGRRSGGDTRSKELATLSKRTPRGPTDWESGRWVLHKLV